MGLEELSLRNRYKTWVHFPSKEGVCPPDLYMFPRVFSRAFLFACLLFTYILKGFSSVKQDTITLTVVYNASSSYTIMMILIIRI